MNCISTEKITLDSYHVKHNILKMLSRAAKYRAYPTPEQATLAQKTFGCRRFVYNKLLEESNDNYYNWGISGFSTPASLKDQFPFLKEVDAHALCNAQLDLFSAFQNFFANIKQGKKTGFPKRKTKKKSRKAYTTNCVHNSIEIKDGKLKLPKLGWIEVVFHRRLFGKIKAVTLSQEPSGKYYVSIKVEIPDFQLEFNPYKEDLKVVGIDLSFAQCAVLSSGMIAKFQRWYLDQEQKLSRLNKLLHRKIIGSKNREKIRTKIAVLNERIRNRRLDFLRKLANYLANNFDVVVIEDIDLRVMKRMFGKSVSDIGFGILKELLGYMLADRGKKLVKAPRFFASTQICSACDEVTGPKGLEDLKVRQWECSQCHAQHDRDENAAKNLEKWYLTVGILEDRRMYGTTATVGAAPSRRKLRNTTVRRNACGGGTALGSEELFESPSEEAGKIEEQDSSCPASSGRGS